MGFGNGNSSRTDHNLTVRTVDGKRGRNFLTNDMLAHVWAAQTQTAGQTANGNAYFIGRTLYSYGTHFASGFHFGDAVFINSERRSVSTSGHISDARGASRHLARYSVADLTEMTQHHTGLAPFADKSVSAVDARAFLARFALQLADAKRMESHVWQIADDAPDAGAFLASLAGLRPGEWPRLRREAFAAAARRQIAKDREERDAAEKRALWLADKPSKEWRALIASYGREYANGRLKSLATELHRARSLFIAAKRGPLAAKSRLATIRARLAQVREEVEAFDARREPRIRRNRILVAIGIVRAWRDMNPDNRPETVTWSMMRDVTDAAETLAAYAPMPLRRAAATMADQARVGMKLIETENAARREAERERQRLAALNARADWIAGTRHYAPHFDADTGGAAMRIYGDELQTSWGASVPLAHAIKVFQFVKLVRQRGVEWRRNGKTIRVGHFHVDHIRADGSFTAGCHQFSWEEVERVAALAGVVDASPSDVAVEPSHVAA